MKRSRKMLLLLAVLAVFAGGYAVVSRISSQETTTVSEQVGSFALLDTQADGITAVSWTDGEETVAFERRDGAWVKTGDESFPVNQEALDALARRAAALTATRELTDVSERGDYGLDEPVFTLTVTVDGGGSIAIAQGDGTPFEDGYYVSVTGRDAIYTVSDPLEDSFRLTLGETVQMESIPEADTVMRVTVGSAVDAIYDEVSASWHDAQPGEPLDGTQTRSLVSDVKALSWSALVNASAGDEELSEWGLSDEAAIVVTLYDGDGPVRTLLLGGEDSGGDRYARLPDSRMVYILEGSDADDILTASIDTLWQKQPVTLGYDELIRAEFAFSAGSVVIEPERSASGTTDGDAAGAQEQDGDAQAQTPSGKEQADEALFDRVTALQGTMRVQEQPSGTPVLTVSITGADGKDFALAFYDYDESSYLLPITDSAAMLVPADDVDALIRMLRQRL